MIDNGHGMETPGKRSPNGKLKEWQYTRLIATKLARELVLSGVPAVRIVEEETDIPLSQRAGRANAYCNKYGKDKCILVSIHCNACPPDDGKWHNARGWSVYTTKGETKSDKLAECIAKAAQDILGKDYAASFTEQDWKRKNKPVRTDMTDGDMDYEENFTVLYKTVCPAVLTENLFQDNLADYDFLLSEKGREAIVGIHLKGILDYIKSVEA